MQCRIVCLAVLAAVAAACGGSPVGPDGGRPPRLSRTSFVAFGDSITPGEVTAPAGPSTTATKMILVPTASYPTQLRSQLQSRYATQASDIRVVNEGVAGETVLSGVLRFEGALDQHRPDVVLLMEGVNGVSGIGPDMSAAAIRGMTQMAKARGMRVFIGSMLPSIAGRQRSQDPAALEMYNTRLREVSVVEGVPFVDLYTTLLPEVMTVIGVDGLHPTEAGYRRVADVFFAAIQANLEMR
jgi:lysophospholipase L1-like esterase